MVLLAASQGWTGCDTLSVSSNLEPSLGKSSLMSS